MQRANVCANRGPDRKPDNEPDLVSDHGAPDNISDLFSYDCNPDGFPIRCSEWSPDIDADTPP